MTSPAPQSQITFLFLLSGALLFIPFLTANAGNTLVTEIQNETHLSLRKVYQAAVERDSVAVGKLILYASKRGPEQVMATEQARIEKSETTCMKLKEVTAISECKAGTTPTKQSRDDFRKDWDGSSGRKADGKLSAALRIYQQHVTEDFFQRKYRKILASCPVSYEQETCDEKLKSYERITNWIASVGAVSSSKKEAQKQKPSLLKELTAIESGTE